MKRPHVSSQDAAQVAENPVQYYLFEGNSHEIAAGSVVIYDDPGTAEAIAAELGTYAKHAENRFAEGNWHTFSIVHWPH